MFWRRAGWTLLGFWLVGAVSSGDWRSLRNGAIIGSVIWLAVNRHTLRLPRRRPRALEPGPSGGGGELVSLDAHRRRRAA